MTLKKQNLMTTSPDNRGSFWLLAQNRYLITAFFALIWVSFVSDIDLIFLMKSQRELNEYHTEAEHFKNRIDSMKLNLHDLSSNPKELERFARERYFMKKPTEDVFRIVESNPHRSL